MKRNIAQGLLVQHLNQVLGRPAHYSDKRSDNRMFRWVGLTKRHVPSDRLVDRLGTIDGVLEVVRYQAIDQTWTLKLNLADDFAITTGLTDLVTAKTQGKKVS